MAIEQIDLELIDDNPYQARSTYPWGNRAISPYVAGIVDGEGSITLAIQCGYHRRVRVSVPQSGLDGLTLLESLRADTGLGRVSPHPSKRPRRLPAYRWIIDRQVECLMLLRTISPFLRLKRRSAEVAIALLEEKARLRRPHSRADMNAWNRQKKWEPHELALLQEQYDTKPETLDELCRLLRRTRKGILMKVWKLGLTSPRGNHLRENSGDAAYSLIRCGHNMQPTIQDLSVRRN